MELVDQAWAAKLWFSFMGEKNNLYVIEVVANHSCGEKKIHKKTRVGVTKIGMDIHFSTFQALSL